MGSWYIIGEFAFSEISCFPKLVRPQLIGTYQKVIIDASVKIYHPSLFVTTLLRYTGSIVTSFP